MKIKELTKVPVVLRAEDVLNELAREELLYLDMHLNISSNDFGDDIIEKISMIRFDDFKENYKRWASKNMLKAKKDQLIKRILPFYEDGFIDTEMLTLTGKSSKTTILIYELAQRRFLQYGNPSIQTITEYITSNLCNVTAKSENSFNIVKVCVAMDFMDIFKKYTEIEFLSFLTACATALYVNYGFLACKHFKILGDNHDKVKKAFEKNNKEIEKLKENNSKLRKAKVEFENECKALRNQKDNKENEFNKVLEHISSQFNKVETNYEKMTKDVKDIKASAEATAYKNEVERLTTQVADLKVTIKEKNNEIKELKKELESRVIPASNTEVAKEVAVEVKEVEVKPSVEPIKVETPKKSTPRFDYTKHRIGYATVENGVHYINFTDNNLPKKSPINNIPLDALIHRKQFVKVNEKHEFLYAFHNTVEDNESGLEDLLIGTVNTDIPTRGDEVNVSIHGRTINVESQGRRNWLKANTVVGVDKFDRITKTFRSTRLVADNVIDSAKAKGMKLLYVMQVLGNNMVVRNIDDTGNDEIISVDLNNNKVVENSIIMVVDNKVIRIINSPRFYNNSKFYPQEKLELATVEMVNGSALAKKVNTGELVMIKSIPLSTHLKQGEIITLDEFGNLAYVNDEKKLIDRVTQVANSTKKKLEAKTSTKAPEITSKVLILGNPSYKNNYKQAFAKEGYDAVTIDGIMRNTSDIERESKGMEYIICVKNHTSHANFWFVKDDLPKTTKKIYTPLAVDGANRIVDMVKNYNLYVNE